MKLYLGGDVVGFEKRPRYRASLNPLGRTDSEISRDSFSPFLKNMFNFLDDKFRKDRTLSERIDMDLNWELPNIEPYSSEREIIRRVIKFYNEAYFKEK